MDMTKTETIDKEQAHHSLEEKLNSLTHSIGAGLSIAGLVFLLLLSKFQGGTPWHYLAFTLYGSFQILLYMTSSLTHLFTDHPKLNQLFRALDQVSIYLLIAGTYTPITLILLRGPWGWTIFGIVWGIALFGIILKTFFTKGVHLLSDGLYLVMGWMIVFALKPLKAVAPEGLMTWIGIGGACYTLGVIFYLLKKLYLGHVVWHLFVLGGSVSFFIGFASYLL